MALRVNLHIPTVKTNWQEALVTVQLEGLLWRVHLKNFQMLSMEKVLKQMQKHIGTGVDSCHCLAYFAVLSLSLSRTTMFYYMIMLELFIYVDRSFDESTWGAFDDNDDVDSVWGFKPTHSKVNQNFLSTWNVSDIYVIVFSKQK
jgi:hypothetical protein